MRLVDRLERLETGNQAMRVVVRYEGEAMPPPSPGLTIVVQKPGRRPEHAVAV